MAEDRSITFSIPRAISTLVGSTTFQKGKTMTQNSLIHVIWDFPVMLFNAGATKFRKYVADRENQEARWLNG
jgi:hypothetical protein